jgi:hypothetical protein
MVMARKPTKKQQEKIDAARIQRAVNGIVIPFSVIPGVYKRAEQLIADGADDAELRSGILHHLAA